MEIGADYIATGHYAQDRYSCQMAGMPLQTSVTAAKDQTYALV